MEQTDSCQRKGVLGCWMKEGEGIKNHIYMYIMCVYIYVFNICIFIYIYIMCKNICITHRHRQQCGDSQRERDVVGSGSGQRGDEW